MRTFKRMAAQGDLVILKIDEFPKDVELEDFKELDNGEYVVAHSETGHNHVMERSNVRIYRPKNVRDNDLFELYADVRKTTALRHKRPFDTHEALVVEPGKYKIRRQREYTPEGFRRAQD